MEDLDGKLKNIAVTREKDDKVYVIGHTGKMLYKIVCDAKTGNVLSEDSVKVPVGYEFFSEKYISGEQISTDKTGGAVMAGVGMTLPLGMGWILYYLTPSIRRRNKKVNELYSKLEQYKKENMEDLRKNADSIAIYDLDPDQVEKLTGKKLRLVDTGEPKKFIEAINSFDMRIKAFHLGADAVIRYQEGSARGTPVKLVDNQ